jgi:hypothetical protein
VDEFHHRVDAVRRVPERRPSRRELQPDITSLAKFRHERSLLKPATRTRLEVETAAEREARLGE